MTETAMTKARANAIVQAAQAALTALCAEGDVIVDGITVKQAGGAKYDPQAGTVRVAFEFTLPGADGRDATAFKQYAHLYGLKPEHHGAVVKMHGTEYRVVGLNTRSPTYPVLVERVDKPSDRRKLGEKYAQLLLGVHASQVKA